MYLSEVFVENFRIFGSEEDGEHLRLPLRRGLNVLVGENDSGKSAAVDAIRYLLWTTSWDYQRLVEGDFHVAGEERASKLTIRCVFRGLSDREIGRYLEWLTVEDGEPTLCMTMKATRLDEEATSTNWRRNIEVTVRSGSEGQGPRIEGEVRDFLRTTYLRPLRDAEAELSAGRGSRLAQILQSHPAFKQHADSDFVEEEGDTCVPQTIVGIMRQAENRIQQTDVVQGTQAQLNVEYLHSFSVGEDALEGEIGVARRAELRHILEKMELWLRSRPGVEHRTARGLGMNNVLFMATELLLLGGAGQSTLPLLLIEEPEAHLHPQMQLRLMEFLEASSDPAHDHPVQILVTTHSPNLASKVHLEAITVMCDGQPYSLACELTQLVPSDYRFLQRFLDVTKANLFFAKGVVLVEGDSENLLLPTLAKSIGRSLSEYGVSIVNVGGRTFLRYAKIFQRTDQRTMPVRVACLVDRDIVPEVAPYVEGGTREGSLSPDEIEAKVAALCANDAEPVRTFVSPSWTLEYDLAEAGLALPVHQAVQLAKKAMRREEGLSDEERATVLDEAGEQVEAWSEEGLGSDDIAARIFEPLYRRQASKPETAQFLAELLEQSGMTPQQMRASMPDYLTSAIDYVTTGESLREDVDAALDCDR
jgi:putative ATP-dependent endonuclease of OLD family